MPDFNKKEEEDEKKKEAAEKEKKEKEKEEADKAEKEKKKKDEDDDDADKAVKYLVEKDGEKHLPYTSASGKPNHRLMGAAWAALHGGYRGNKYEGPDKQKAIKRLKQVYAREGMETPAEKGERIDGLLKGMVEDSIQKRYFGYLGKGMYTVGRFAQICEDLKYLWMSLEYEREEEGDESPVTDDLKETLMDLLDHLLEYTTEQVEEEHERFHEKSA